ncbi:FtsK/SpoIIIE domain-containing protein [Thermoactinospora rubra]|uniref:FtsK/SpoIIIE domain-containing protein n=1 Tax=Thermoactinospora rubra TaxID=1088767 RepID=UPI001F0ACA40|nr:FtsK/SpoIIIE domain-containing protein [Thermoactinospora rubra]
MTLHEALAGSTVIDEPGGVVEVRVVGGPGSGAVHRLGIGIHVIGSDPACAVAVPDASLAPEAAVLRVTPEAITVEPVRQAPPEPALRPKLKGRYAEDVAALLERAESRSLDRSTRPGALANATPRRTPEDHEPPPVSRHPTPLPPGHRGRSGPGVPGSRAHPETPTSHDEPGPARHHATPREVGSAAPTPPGRGRESPWAGPASSIDLLLDFLPLEDRRDWPEGSLLTCGASVLTLAAIEPPDAHLAPTPEGGLAYNRPPRLRRPETPRRFERPKEPGRTEGIRLQLLAAVLPALLGLGLALALRQWYFLLIALMTPLIMIGQWWSDRRHGRRRHRQALKEYQSRLETFELSVEEARRLDELARRADAPDAAELLLTATGPRRRLWERRIHDADALRLRVGLADLPANLELVEEQGARLDPPTCRAVPVTLAMRRLGVAGVTGPRDTSTALANWLIGQAAILHSPRDLAIVVLSAHADGESRWGWVRWLPHCAARHSALSADGAALVGADPETAARRIAELNALIDERLNTTIPDRGKIPTGWDDLGGPATPTEPAFAPYDARPFDVLVVLDGAQVLRSLPGMPQVLRQGPRAGVYTLAVDDDQRLLPEECATVAACGHDGLVRLRGGGLDALGPVVADQVAPSWCDRVGRALAAIRDVSREDQAAGLPESVRLLDLLGMTAPGGAEVASRWKERGTTSALIGVGPEGPFAVDLGLDGPHGLIAGTTGAGKSELLQTLICSLAVANRPDQLTFVLVDYKGGAAFNDCVRLPHTVGMVTDLDGHLTRRALDSLAAEIRRRERLLLAAGAKDIDDYWDKLHQASGPGPFPPPSVSGSPYGPSAPVRPSPPRSGRARAYGSGHAVTSKGQVSGHRSGEEAGIGPLEGNVAFGDAALGSHASPAGDTVPRRRPPSWGDGSRRSDDALGGDDSPSGVTVPGERAFLESEVTSARRALASDDAFVSSAFSPHLATSGPGLGTFSSWRGETDPQLDSADPQPGRLRPLPRLVLIIDEFAALVAELPDFVTGLVDIARRGRSLGIHLILATQRPAGVVTADIQANTSLRIALRVTEPAESADVIGVADAAHISRSTPGRCYVRSGAAPATAVQAARIGGRSVTAQSGGTVRVSELTWRGLGRPLPPMQDKSDDSGTSNLALLVDAVAEAARLTGVPAQPSPWLDPLPSQVVLDDLVAPRVISPAGVMSTAGATPTAGAAVTDGALSASGSPSASGATSTDSPRVGTSTSGGPTPAPVPLTARTPSGARPGHRSPDDLHPRDQADANLLGPGGSSSPNPAYHPEGTEAPSHHEQGSVAIAPLAFGVTDLPWAQARRPLVLDLEHGGHLLIAGSARTGRSTALRTIAGAIAARTSPADVHLHAIDCGSGALLPLVALPHCGAVVTRDQLDRVERLLTRLRAEVGRRQQLLAEAGHASLAEYRRAGNRLPWLVLMVDRWEGYVAAFEGYDYGRLTESLLHLLREGGAVGLRAVVTGDRSALIGQVSTVFDERLILRLADPSDYGLAGLPIKDLPSTMPPGRAVSMGEHGIVESQVALLDPDPSGPAQVAALQALARLAWAPAHQVAHEPAPPDATLARNHGRGARGPDAAAETVREKRHGDRHTRADAAPTASTYETAPPCSPESPPSLKLHRSPESLPWPESASQGSPESPPSTESAFRVPSESPPSPEPASRTSPRSHMAGSGPPTAGHPGDQGGQDTPALPPRTSVEPASGAAPGQYGIGGHRGREDMDAAHRPQADEPRHDAPASRLFGRSRTASANRKSGRSPWVWDGEPPLRVDALPSRITMSQTLDLDPAFVPPSPLWALIGAGGDALTPMGLDLLAHGPGAVIAGPPRSGRSSALMTAALSLIGQGTPVIVVTPRRSPLRALEGAHAVLDGDGTVLSIRAMGSAPSTASGKAAGLAASVVADESAPGNAATSNEHPLMHRDGDAAAHASHATGDSAIGHEADAFAAQEADRPYITGSEAGTGAGDAGVVSGLTFEGIVARLERYVVIVDDAELVDPDGSVGMLLSEILRTGRDGEHGLIIAGATGDLATAYRGFVAEARKSRTGLLLAVQSPADGDLFTVRLPRGTVGGPPGRGLLVTMGTLTPIQAALPD